MGQQTPFHARLRSILALHLVSSEVCSTILEKDRRGWCRNSKHGPQRCGVRSDRRQQGSRQDVYQRVSLQRLTRLLETRSETRGELRPACRMDFSPSPMSNQSLKTTPGRSSEQRLLLWTSCHFHLRFSGGLSFSDVAPMMDRPYVCHLAWSWRSGQATVTQHNGGRVCWSYVRDGGPKKRTEDSRLPGTAKGRQQAKLGTFAAET